MKTLLVFAALCLASTAHAAKRIEIGTVHGTMKYDIETFLVDPGEAVTLVFTNTDEMQHNLVICKPGPHMEIAEKAWLLGADAVEKHYIPDHPRILSHTKIIDPGKSETIAFTAPTAEGDYPYVCTLPGHAHLMHGIMRVGSSAAGLRDLGYAYYEGDWTKLPDFATLTPTASGTLLDGKIDIGVAEREDHFALLFTATLDVPADGEYTFYLNSDDGSRLLVNDSPVVTYDGIHPAEGERNGRVRLTKGPHPLRLEFFEHTRDQVLTAAWEGPSLKRIELAKETSPAPTDDCFRPRVIDTPLVIRAFLADGPPRAISVGLPGGTSYCFDPEIGAVVFGWTGDFLDIAPDRGQDAGARGGGWCKVLGKRFSVGTAGFPIRFGSPKRVPAVAFRGYRRAPLPEFHLTADGIPIRQTIRAASSGPGLEYTFEIDSPPANVFFTIDPDGLDLKSSAGTWTGGILEIPAAEAARFTVALTRR